MERSSTFTAVPGVGGCVMGGIALVAALVGSWQPSGDRWLLTWLAAATARRFAAALAAPFVAGAAITYALWTAGNFTVMTPAWLLLYGAGLLTGGIFSVPAVRAIGACFMGLGLLAILTPPGWGNFWLALGFGSLQIGFGVYIARNHGG